MAWPDTSVDTGTIAKRVDRTWICTAPLGHRRIASYKRQASTVVSRTDFPGYGSSRRAKGTALCVTSRFAREALRSRDQARHDSNCTKPLCTRAEYRGFNNGTACCHNNLVSNAAVVAPHATLRGPMEIAVSRRWSDGVSVC